MKSKRTFQPEFIPEPKQPDAFGGREAVGEAATASGSAGGAAVEPGQPPSMAESVTRHALNPPFGNDTYLLCGIDSLDLGLFVEWGKEWPEVKKILEDTKKKAQGTDGLLEEMHPGRKYLFFPGGKGDTYRYHLQFNEYHLFIAKADKPGKTPNVYLSINSATIWQHGPLHAINLVIKDLKYFSGEVDGIVPSRMDICADFKLASPVTLSFLLDHAVCRSRDLCVYMKKHDEFEMGTCYLGAPAAPIRLRMYNKGEEAIKKGKQEMYATRWGIEDISNTWRVEFQLRRTALKQFKVNNIDDIFNKLGGLWEYLTDRWFSLRFPDNDKSERRTLHPWWLEVQSCGDKLGNPITVTRNYTSDVPETVHGHLAHVQGRMISIAAQCGIKDRKKAMLKMCELLLKNSNDIQFTSEAEKRAIKRGYNQHQGGEGHE